VNSLLRLFLVCIAGLFGGLALYAASGNIGWLGGDIGAMLWFVGCAWLAGYIAHRALPREDTSGLVNVRSVVVECEGDVVSCALPDGKTERVAWNDLQRVEIITTDEGPGAADVFWMLHGSATGCVVPQGATGANRLLERLQALPHFDNSAVIQAMGSTSNNRFLVWSRKVET
jgi:hypothetical protein